MDDLEQDELDFLRDLTADVMELAKSYVGDPRVAALVEKLEVRIAELEGEE
jgi:hypothetical protein